MCICACRHQYSWEESVEEILANADLSSVPGEVFAKEQDNDGARG